MQVMSLQQLAVGLKFALEQQAMQLTMLWLAVVGMAVLGASHHVFYLDTV